LVIEGTSAFAEDTYRRFEIDGIRFHAAKPCARCIIPSIDPNSGDKEPRLNKVLASYRIKDNAIMFGQNLIHDGVGQLQVGSEVFL
jgi:hypothetical protein